MRASGTMRKNRFERIWHLQSGMRLWKVNHSGGAANNDLRGTAKEAAGAWGHGPEGSFHFKCKALGRHGPPKALNFSTDEVFARTWIDAIPNYFRAEYLVDTRLEAILGLRVGNLGPGVLMMEQH